MLPVAGEPSAVDIRQSTVMSLPLAWLAPLSCDRLGVQTALPVSKTVYQLVICHSYSRLMFAARKPNLFHPPLVKIHSALLIGYINCV